ncbi:MAG: hypothetical protein PHQ34_01620 [Methanothrix sp.]|nr:hypothetical protein [Methanothrix sp.]
MNIFDLGKCLRNNGQGLKNMLLLIVTIFALNAFSLNLGYMSPIFSRLCGSVVLLSALLFYYDQIINAKRDKVFLLGFAIVIIAFIMLFLSFKVELWLASLPLFLYGFYLILRSNETNVNELPALVFGSVTYILLYLAILYSSILWRFLQFISLFLSHAIGLQRGFPLSLGSSVEGLPVLLSFISVSISFFAFSKKNIGVLKNFLLLISSMILLIFAFVYLHTTSWLPGEQAIYSIYVLFLLLLIPFLIFIPRFDLKSVDIGDSVPKMRDRAILGILFISLVFMTVSPYSSSDHFGKVVFYEKDCEMNFDLPQFPEDNGYLPQERGFSVGALQLYLRTVGHEVVKYNQTDSKALKDLLTDADILVLMNLNRPMNNNDLQSIWDFVEHGGSLLVFGEHTSMFANDRDFALGRDYLNDILKPTGIRINPDTAEFFSGAWKYVRFPFPHPVTKDLGFGITTSSVGASLDINGSARPVLVGSYAFSDNPNPGEPGHLGDRGYELGEKLGDIILAASDTYGLGNILVFGDTSYVLNPEVPNQYRLIDNSIAWLLSEKSDLLAGLSLISTFAIFFMIMYFIRYLFLSNVISPFPLYTSLILASSIIVSGSINDSLMRISQEEEIADIAWIDHTHLNRFDLDGYTSGSIDGLSLNLIRNGYMPLILSNMDNFDQIHRGKVAIIIAPSRGYTSEEAQMLKKFVENGGLLMISAGYDSEKTLKQLFVALKIDVLDIPLGSPPWIVETHGQSAGVVSEEKLRIYWHKPKFMDAYPVQAEGNYTSITTMRYEGSDYKLIITKDIGKGKVVLIGDSRFLLNENLEYLTLGSGEESKEDYQLQWLGNIELFKGIMSRYRGEIE